MFYSDVETGRIHTEQDQVNTEDVEATECTRNSLFDRRVQGHCHGEGSSAGTPFLRAIFAHSFAEAL